MTDQDILRMQGAIHTLGTMIRINFDEKTLIALSLGKAALERELSRAQQPVASVTNATPTIFQVVAATPESLMEWITTNSLANISQETKDACIKSGVAYLNQLYKKE